MVTKQSVDAQLKKIKFNVSSWGRTEANELCNILIEGEEIYECANGIYDGGFALLVATDIRLLLIDKKPLNYLTVEDLRFDMINEIDYSHRLFGATINVAAGAKNLHFTSMNQQRLRKLIGHVQHCMAESKKKQSEHQEDQNQHLEEINQRLQVYLYAQHQHQELLQRQLEEVRSQGDLQIDEVTSLKPDPGLSDYLFAQNLLAEHRQKLDSAPHATLAEQPSQPPQPVAAGPPAANRADSHNPQLNDLYAEGVQEVFGKHKPAAPAVTTSVSSNDTPTIGFSSAFGATNFRSADNPLDVNPLTIAYSKLPMALRNRKFGRPSFHAHSQSPESRMRAQPATSAVN